MSKFYQHARLIILSSVVAAILCSALLLPPVPGGVALQSASAQRVNARRLPPLPPPPVQQTNVDRATITRAESFTKDRFTYFTETPRGARVVAVNRPRVEALQAIDAGLAELFAVARRNNYRARVNYSDYIVFIARADRTRDSVGVYSPDMAFDATYYAGTVYDQGGYIYAAGMVFSYTPAALVVAEHERDWGRMSNVVRYEGEHLILFHNDRRRFQETADHTRGGAHPILK